MKVLFVIDTLSGGGAQRQLVELARQLDAREFSTGVVTYRDPSGDGERSGVESRLHGTGVRRIRLDRKPGAWRAFVRRFSQTLDQEAPDLIHAFLPTPSFWTLLAMGFAKKRPCLVVSERASVTAGPRLQRLLRRVVYPAAQCVIANSKASHTALAAYRVGRLKATHYVPNGIDARHWSFEPKPPALSPTLDFGLLGRFESEKNHQGVLRALTRIPTELRARLRVHFVGAATGGEEEVQALRERVRTLGLDPVVTLTPAVDDPRRLVRDLDFLLLASLHEGFPNVVLEAMALGTPVLSSDVGDVGDMLDGGACGAIYSPNTPEALAEAIISCSQLSAGERQAMVQRARARVEEMYSIDRVTELHCAIYDQAVSGRPGARVNR